MNISSSGHVISLAIIAAFIPVV